MSQAGSEIGQPGRFAANTAVLIAGRLVVAVLGWGGTVLIARDLGAEGFGQFTLLFSLLGMLSIVTDMGVGRVAVAALLDPKIDRAAFAGTYVVLRTVLGLAGYLLLLGFVWLANYPPVVFQAALIGGLVVVISTPSHAYDVAFQVRDRLAPLAVAGVFGQLAQVSLTIALVLRGGSLVWFVVPAVLNDLVILFWKVPAAHRLTGFRYRVDLKIWSDLIKEAIPLSAGAAFVTIYYRVDSIMLSKLDTFSAVGSYGVAYKFVDLVHFLPTAVGMALLAPLTAAWPQKPEDFHNRAAEALRLLAIAAGAVWLGFWLFSTEAVGLLYGSEYRNSGLATSIVVTGETLTFASTVAITALIATNRHRWYPVITLGGLVANVALNLVFIPRWSFEGAAVTTLLTEALVLIFLWQRFSRIPGWSSRDQLGTLWRLPLAVLAGVAAAVLVKMFAPWPVAAAAGIGCYGGAVIALRVLPSWRPAG